MPYQLGVPSVVVFNDDAEPGSDALLLMAFTSLRVPQAGFEPARARFLRPPPLPLGYCGLRPREGEAPAEPRTPSVSALSWIRTSNTGNLSPGPLPGWATRAHRLLTGCRRESNPHLLGASQASSQLDDGPITFFSKRCGKDSNLHPPASEAGAPSD